MSIFLVILWKGTRLYDPYAIYCDTKLKLFQIHIFTSHGGLLTIKKFNVVIPNKLEINSKPIFKIQNQALLTISIPYGSLMNFNDNKKKWKK
jgi:hypothetical protein